MAHRPTQPRKLAAPEPSTPPMDPSLPKHLKPTAFTANPSRHRPASHPDLAQASQPSFTVNRFSRLNLSHKFRTPSKPTNHSQPSAPLIDSHLQAKAMSASAIVDSSNLSLIKPNTQNTKLAPKVETESNTAKKTPKEKPQKPTTELERKKLQGVIENVKKDSNGGLDKRSLFEEIKIEKSRDPHHDIERPSVSLSLSDGRRRSFCGSQVDIGDAFAINGVKVASADMPPFMQIHAVDYARKTYDSMEKFTSKTLALNLKKEFDGVYGPAWHCIVGTSFGSFVTHSDGGFLYFSMDQKLYILLFKTYVQKAD